MIFVVLKLINNSLSSMDRHSLKQIQFGHGIDNSNNVAAKNGKYILKIT